MNCVCHCKKGDECLMEEFNLEYKKKYDGKCGTCKHYTPDQSGWGSCIKRPKGRNLFTLTLEFYTCTLYEKL